MGLIDQIGTGIKSAFVEKQDRQISIALATDKQIEAMKAQGVGNKDGYTTIPVEMANTVLDRHNEAFTKAILDEYARQINEQGLTFNQFHERSRPVGMVAKRASVEVGIDKAGQPIYSLWSYVQVNDKAILPDQPSITVVEAIKDGMLTNVSVEVSGNVQWIDKGNGNGYYEWYIDPERPERTEISGLALVQRGAQRGAALSVKSADGKPIEKTKSNTVYMFKDKYFVGGKEYAVTAKQEGNEITAEGIDALVADFRESAKTAAEAITAKAALEAENATLKTELTEARKGFEADLVNYTKLNGGTEPTDEAMKAMSFVTLKAAADQAKATHDAKATNPMTPSTEAAPSYKFQQ